MKIRVKAKEDCFEGGGFRNKGETFEVDLEEGQELAEFLVAIDPNIPLTVKLPPGSMTLADMDGQPYKDRNLKVHQIPLSHHQI